MFWHNLDIPYKLGMMSGSASSASLGSSSGAPRAPRGSVLLARDSISCFTGVGQLGARSTYMASLLGERGLLSVSTFHGRSIWARHNCNHYNQDNWIWKYIQNINCILDDNHKFGDAILNCDEMNSLIEIHINRLRYAFDGGVQFLDTNIRV